MPIKRVSYSEFGGDLNLSKENRLLLYILTIILMISLVLFILFMIVLSSGEEPIIDWRYAYGYGFIWVFMGILLFVVIFSKRTSQQ